MLDVVAARPRQIAGAYQIRDGRQPVVPARAKLVPDMPVLAHAYLFISDFHTDPLQINILNCENGGARASRGRAVVSRT